jgi:hypothetical protein
MVGELMLVEIDILADLVAGHLHTLWQQTIADGPEDERGCCPDCCAPCHALRELHRRGRLDGLYRYYMDISDGKRASALWDQERNQLDRAWFDKAWGRMDCGMSHDTDRLSGN